MSKFVCAAVSGITAMCSLSANANAQNPDPTPARDFSVALAMKLDALVEQLPVGRYKVTKSAIDAQGASIGQPLRDGHICIKTVGQIADVVSSYATTFDLSIMAWKAEGAACRNAYHGDDASAIHETMCPITDKMKAPSRWNVLEADASCKVTYTDTGRQRTCNEVGADVVQVATGPAQSKQMSSNHYLSGAISVPGKSLRLHLREFDTSATATKFVAGHSVTATKTTTECEPSDRPATSIAD
jgi:hypothetical protein